jgi:formate dehydrogenase iron-sulfur subunit
MVTRRIKPMMIDGKKTYQIGIPIHWGYRGIAEDEGKTALDPVNLLSPDGRRSERLHARVQGLPREGGKGPKGAPMPTELQIKRSRPTRARSRRGVQRGGVCKYIDVTTCIGCKACEVACVEWNDMPFQQTTFDNTYQTMPSTAWNYWNLIKFNEHERDDGTLMWLMRKDQCMHCEDPGCLRACPADGAIVQYTNGIVDFQQENCIGCGTASRAARSTFPKFNETTKKVYKCTLCSDRVGEGLEPACIKACPTGCLKFGTKDDMRALADARAQQLREHSGFKNAGVYDPPSVGGTHVIYVLHDATQAGALRRLPVEPDHPAELHGLEVARQAGRAC